MDEKDDNRCDARACIGRDTCLAYAEKAAAGNYFKTLTSVQPFPCEWDDNSWFPTWLTQDYRIK